MLSDDTNQNLTTRNEARALYMKMEKLENAFLCDMCNNILQHVHKTSTALQAVELDLCNAVTLISSLRDHLASLRDDFDKFESAAKDMSPTVSQHYKVDTQRQRKRKNKQMKVLNLTVNDQAETSSKQQFLSLS